MPQSKKYPYASEFCKLVLHCSSLVKEEHFEAICHRSQSSLRAGMIWLLARAMDADSERKTFFEEDAGYAFSVEELTEEEQAEDLSLSLPMLPIGNHILGLSLVAFSPYVGCWREVQIILFSLAFTESLAEAVLEALLAAFQDPSGSEKDPEKILYGAIKDHLYVVDCSMAPGLINDFYRKTWKREPPTSEAFFNACKEDRKMRESNAAFRLRDTWEKELATSLIPAFCMWGTRIVEHYTDRLAVATGGDEHGELACAACDYPFVWRTAYSEDWVHGEAPIEFDGYIGAGGVATYNEGPISESDRNGGLCEHCCCCSREKYTSGHCPYCGPVCIACGHIKETFLCREAVMRDVLKNEAQCDFMLALDEDDRMIECEKKEGEEEEESSFICAYCLEMEKVEEEKRKREAALKNTQMEFEEALYGEKSGG